MGFSLTFEEKFCEVKEKNYYFIKAQAESIDPKPYHLTSISLKSVLIFHCDSSSTGFGKRASSQSQTTSGENSG